MIRAAGQYGGRGCSGDGRLDARGLEGRTHPRVSGQVGYGKMAAPHAQILMYLRFNLSRFHYRMFLPLLLLLSLPAFADVSGRVVAVADGDTVTILDIQRTQHRVRLAGIDAPEKGQPFGQRAKERMSDLVFDKEVRLEGDKRDRYGRTVAKVWVTPPDCPRCGQTLDAGLTLLTVGLAWHYKKYQKEQTAEDRERYSFAQYEAKAKRAGLWADPEPIPPWEWRRARW
jgi:endonuclease YncB( thermonuclease family)